MAVLGECKTLEGAKRVLAWQRKGQLNTPAAFRSTFRIQKSGNMYKLVSTTKSNDFSGRKI